MHLLHILRVLVIMIYLSVNICKNAFRDILTATSLYATKI